jgi:hypothetical protein
MDPMPVAFEDNTWVVGLVMLLESEHDSRRQQHRSDDSAL